MPDPRLVERPVLSSGSLPRAIVGLGNPGSRYERTRHNAGFLVVERLRSEAGAVWETRPDREECLVRLGGAERLLVRPLTFMNRSGLPVSAVLAETGFEPDDLLVVVDDTALPAGRLRFRRRGGPGGHNGLISICESLGSEEFIRLRVGVGPAPPEVDLAVFVLEPLDGEAWSQLEGGVDRAAEAVGCICREGLAAAMNRYNPAPVTEGDGS